MSREKFGIVLAVAAFWGILIVLSMNLQGCTTTDGMGQDEIDWIIDNTK